MKDFKLFLNKLTLVFNEEKLNWSKVTVKTFFFVRQKKAFLLTSLFIKKINYMVLNMIHQRKKIWFPRKH